MVMGWIPDGKFNMQHALLLCASSMCTAALASFVLGRHGCVYPFPLRSKVKMAMCKQHKTRTACE
ncbi:hypothetical protein DPMN_121687 [Dreissena polymorpha]|uniref:Uncharacterized protein n=1 Tax=Dreissena polymorpha TaxID=45954 RepID=A0A9D4GQI8_DREPO|nr:hypothetical protein DPMN_121687 [Dreissena polymorpha]